jgi:hypothetical protein
VSRCDSGRLLRPAIAHGDGYSIPPHRDGRWGFVDRAPKVPQPTETAVIYRRLGRGHGRITVLSPNERFSQLQEVQLEVQVVKVEVELRKPFESNSNQTRMKLKSNSNQTRIKLESNSKMKLVLVAYCLPITPHYAPHTLKRSKHTTS